MMVPQAVHDGLIAATNAVRGATTTLADQVSPIGSFTDPEYAQVGLTEAKARESHDVAVTTIRFDENPRAIIDGRATGFCKLIVDRPTATILGCHVVGGVAGQWVAEGLAGVGVPQPHGVVVTARGDAGAVGAKRHAGHNARVARRAKHTGDGIFALFNGPTKAARCALDLVPAVATRGIQIRAGVHIGECERRGDEWSGMAVHTGARIVALAGAGEVLASRMVRDLSAGSGLTFKSLGPQRLKGLPEEVDVYRAATPTSGLALA